MSDTNVIAFPGASKPSSSPETSAVMLARLETLREALHEMVAELEALRARLKVPAD